MKYTQSGTYEFKADKSGLYHFILVGAGTNYTPKTTDSRATGSTGGLTEGDIDLVKGQTVYIAVGSPGYALLHDYNNNIYSADGYGGWPFGGNGAVVSNVGGTDLKLVATGGGGLSAISFYPFGSTYGTFFESRPIAVAGGGGGVSLRYVTTSRALTLNSTASNSNGGGTGDLYGGSNAIYGNDGYGDFNSGNVYAGGGSGYPNGGSTLNGYGKGGLGYISDIVKNGYMRGGGGGSYDPSLTNRLGYAEINLIEEYPDDNKIFIGDKAIPSMYIGDKPVVSAAIGDYKLL